MSDVPPDLIAGILSRLPVKSLLQFRCVSKPFCALIDSDDFIKLHLDRSLKFNSYRTLIVSTQLGLVHYIDFDSLDEATLLGQRETQVLGSCNGLLLLSLGDFIFLSNPLTLNDKQLPVSEVVYPEQPYFIRVHTVVYGFGYDHVNDDYKVLRISQFVDEVEEVVMDKNEVKVYSMKSNSWKTINDFPYIFYNSEKDGVLVNGALHWIVVVKEDPSKTSSTHIVSFDLATEEYHLIPLPEYTPCKDGETLLYDPDSEEYYDSIPNEMIMEIVELGGKLCVQCKYNMRYIDIWVMNCYSVKDSWTKLCSVAQPVNAFRSEYLKAIAYSKDREKLLLEQKGGRLAWYDLKLNNVKDIRIPGNPEFFKPYMCMESLVKLPSGIKNDATKEQKGKEKRKSFPKRDDFLSKGFKLKL